MGDLHGTEKLAEPQPGSSVYLVGPWCDGMCIGGFSLIFCAFTFAFGSFLNVGSFVLAAGYLVWVVNWPHFSATLYRLYSRRETIRNYPITSLLSPIFIIAGTAACFIDTEYWTVAWIRLLLLWSPYHYSGQNIGLTRLYAKRAGWNLSVWEGRVLATFVFCSFLGPTLTVEALPKGSEHFSVPVPSFGLPAWMGTAAYAVMYAAAVLWLGVWLRRRYVLGVVSPWICLIPAFSQMVWFVFAPNNRSFYPLVACFHSLQYLFLAWVLELHERLVISKPSQTRVSGKQMARVSAVWLGVNIVGGALLFYFIPDWVSSFTRQSRQFSEAVLIAGVQIHHFLIDGVIWRLRDPRVASPLRVRWSDFSFRPARHAPAIAVFAAFFCLPSLAFSMEGFGGDGGNRVVHVSTTTGDLLIRLNGSPAAHAFRRWVDSGVYDSALVQFVESRNRIVFGGAKLRKVPFPAQDLKAALGTSVKAATEYQPLARGQFFLRGAGSQEGSFELALNEIPALAQAHVIGELVQGWAAVDEMQRARRNPDRTPAFDLQIRRAESFLNQSPRPFQSIVKLPRNYKDAATWTDALQGPWFQVVLATIVVISILLVLFLGKWSTAWLLALAVVQASLGILVLVAALVPSLGNNAWSGVAMLGALLLIVRIFRRFDSVTSESLPSSVQTDFPEKSST